MRDKRETKILDLLEEKKSIHYIDLMTVLDVSGETARRCAVEIAQLYPRNIEYIRGLLRLKKSLALDDLPPEKRIRALQKTIETNEAIKKKLKKNHLPHLQKAILAKDHAKIQEELSRLKKLLRMK